MNRWAVIGLTLLVLFTAGVNFALTKAYCEGVKVNYEKGDQEALDRVGETGGFIRSRCNLVGVNIGNY